PDGSGVNAGAGLTSNGSLTIGFGGDAPATSTLEVQDKDGTWIDILANSTTVQGEYGLLSVDLDGTWSYLLSDNTLDHNDIDKTGDGDSDRGADDQVFDNFATRVTDSDGDSTADNGISASEIITVAVNDDGPELGAFTDISIDNEVGSENGTFSYTPGADGHSGFAVTGPTLDGVTYSSADNATGTLLTATAGSDTVFSLQVNFDGTYTFNLITPEAATTETISLQSLPPGGPDFRETSDGRVEFSSPDGINSSTNGFGVSNQFVANGEAFTMEFHDPGAGGDDPVGSNPDFVDAVNLVNNSINGSLTITWTATNTVTGATDTGVIAVSGSSTEIDPNISFNQLLIEGTGGSGQGVRFSAADISRTVLPKDQDLSFDIVATDGDGDTDSSSVNITLATPDNVLPEVGDKTVRVSEEGLPNGIIDNTGHPNNSHDTTNEAEATNVIFGAIPISDSDGSVSSISLAAPADGAFTSGGVDVDWTGGGTDSLTAKAGSVDIATLTVDTDGTYTFTLTGPIDHPNNSVEDTLTIGFDVTATDNNGGSDTGSFSVVVEDDMPVAPAVAHNTADPVADTNIMIILDTSGSMGDNSGIDKPGPGNYTRLEAAVIAIKQLLDAYDALGNVKVKLITFASNDSREDWSSIAAAKTILDSLSDGGGTDYDEALEGAMSSTGFTQSGAISGANNVSYFLSDGEPTEQRGVSNGEEDTWEAFLSLHDIYSYAIGMGTGITTSAQNELNQVAYDGITPTEANAIVVDDFSDLSDVILATVPDPVGGSLLGGGVAPQVGADGGYIESITINGRTYTYSPDSDSVAVSGGSNQSSFAAGTDTLTVTVPNGGEWTVQLTGNGDYSYQPPAGATDGTTYTMGYKIVDNDGDFGNNGVASNVTVTIGSPAPFTTSAFNNLSAPQRISGEDEISGTDRDDTLTGNDGDNTLIGGPGSDTMTGGLGVDT
ncbi:MAG: VWA domain-containing protein, partial [Spongiibacteraceae bacterium]